MDNKKKLLIASIIAVLITGVFIFLNQPKKEKLEPTPGVKVEHQSTETIAQEEEVKTFDLLTKNDKYSKLGFMSDRLLSKIKERLDKFNKQLGLNYVKEFENHYMNNEMMWVIKNNNINYLVDVMGNVIGMENVHEYTPDQMLFNGLKKIKDKSGKEFYIIKNYSHSLEFFKTTGQIITKDDLVNSSKSGSGLGLIGDYQYKNSIVITELDKTYDIYQQGNTEVIFFSDFNFRGNEVHEIIGIYFKDEPFLDLDKLKEEFIKYGNFKIIRTTEGEVWVLEKG